MPFTKFIYMPNFACVEARSTTSKGNKDVFFDESQFSKSLSNGSNPLCIEDLDKPEDGDKDPSRRGPRRSSRSKAEPSRLTYVVSGTSAAGTCSCSVSCTEIIGASCCKILITSSTNKEPVSKLINFLSSI
ncbi:hypothetical protein O6H91_Y562200 [Diphasiastrum complanatum]|nr:hypothetical protein O6H91_Y562200 [Diphasiastrum complanatum]